MLFNKLYKAILALAEGPLCHGMVDNGKGCEGGLNLLLSMASLSPDYRYNSKAGYAESTVRYELDSKKCAEQRHANAACNGYSLANSSLVSQNPALLVADQ